MQSLIKNLEGRMLLHYETIFKSNFLILETKVSFYFAFIISVSLVLVAEGLCCCLGDSGCGEREQLSVAARGFHIAVASLVVEHRLWVPGLSRCDA